MALCSGFQTMVGGKPLPLFGSQTICNLHCQYKIQNVGFVVFGFTFSFFCDVSAVTGVVRLSHNLILPALILLHV